jgi:hypothetical protein
MRKIRIDLAHAGSWISFADSGGWHRILVIERLVHRASEIPGPLTRVQTYGGLDLTFFNDTQVWTR